MSKPAPSIPNEMMDRVDDLVGFMARHAPYGAATRRNVFLHALALGLDQLEGAQSNGDALPQPQQQVPPTPPPNTTFPTAPAEPEVQDDTP